MLSNTCKYALRATVFIALNATETKKVGLKKVAESLNIPSPFLAKILQTLSKRKILASTKGPNGGFALASVDTTIYTIYETIDGTEYFEECLIGVQSCTDDPVNTPCPLHGRYSHIRTKIHDIFKNTTIIDLAKDIEMADGLINI